MNNSYLWVQQYDAGDGNTVEIIKLTMGSGSAEDTQKAYDRLQRMPFDTNVNCYQDKAVWFEMVLDHDLQDDSIVVTPDRAAWILGEFCNIKRGWKGKLRK